MAAAVTVGIPVVNELDYLRLAVKSVFAQSYDQWELIIVCDGSRSETVEAARSIRCDRVRVVADGQSRGLPSRLNEITEAAQTPLVARMDADDVMHPLRLERQLRVFEQTAQLDMLGTGSFVIDDESHLCGLNRSSGIPSKSAGYLATSVFCHSSVMFTRDWALTNPYSPDWVRTEDKELWLRSHKCSRFAQIEDPLQFYRISRHLSPNRQAITARNDRELMRRYWRQAETPIHEWLTLDFKSRTKQAVYGMAGILGADEAVYRHKFVTIPPEVLGQAEAALETVASTEVPGWD